MSVQMQRLGSVVRGTSPLDRRCHHCGRGAEAREENRTGREVYSDCLQFVSVGAGSRASVVTGYGAGPPSEAIFGSAAGPRRVRERASE